MKNVSIKKLSLLGLVLVAASAVTAAILPKKATVKHDRPGNLIQSSGGQSQTCITGVNNQCNATLDSDTTVDSGGTSTDNAHTESTNVNTTANS